MISKKTIEALKMFSKISSKVVINDNKNGIITIRNEVPSVMGIYTIPEEDSHIPQIAIYDLNQFISIISKMEITKIDFSEKYCEIYSKTDGLKYYYAAIELIPKRPKVEKTENGLWTIKMPDDVGDWIININLSSAQLSKIIEMTKILGYEYISIQSDKENIFAVMHDVVKDNANIMKSLIGKNEMQNSKNTITKFRLEDISILSLDHSYDMSVIENTIAKFVQYKREGANKNYTGIEIYISAVANKDEK